MKVSLELKLTKLASGSGGDRYEDKYKGKSVVLYFPQTISREDGPPKKKLYLTVGDEK